jgi:peptidoglycan hydrolase-like protein with peptidoglycan-binding domain
VKTRAKLQEIYTLYTENEKVRIEEENRIALMKVEQEKRMIAQKTEVTLFVQSFGNPKPNEAGIHIRNLQQSLKALGHFSGKDTAIFGKNTRAALISYQTQENIPVDEL